MTQANKSRPDADQHGWLPHLLIALTVLYLTLIVLLPTANVFISAFAKGVGPVLEALADQNLQSAVGLTLIMAAIAVPLNTLFGLCAAWAIARKQFPGRTLVLSILDIPFSISPVVVGLMLVLLYGRTGLFAPLLEWLDLKILFAIPGMAIATAFVTLSFVAREVIPVLEEQGSDAEEAAKTLGANDWQTFWRVTLPSIRWSLLYGVILTNARAMGEFGAVSVVSGNIAGKTQTLPLFVEEAYKSYHTEAAFTAAMLLAGLALITLVLKALLEQKGVKSDTIA
jgi:sulfate transport system permease protein